MNFWIMRRGEVSSPLIGWEPRMGWETQPLHMRPKVFSEQLLRDKAGFSLIEQVISLALISITVVTLLIALSVGIRAADGNRDNAYLIELARSQLEDIYKQPYSDSHVYSTISPVPAGYSIQISVSVPATYTYASPGSVNTPETIQLIAVTASGDWTSVNLSGFKVKQ